MVLGVDAVRRLPPRGVRGVLLAPALAVVVLPFSVGIVRDAGLGPAWNVAVGVALLVLHTAVGLRRRAPLPAYLACAGAELVLALAPNLPDAAGGAAYPAVLLPSSVCYLLAAYAVSTAGRGRAPAATLVVGVVGSLAVTLRAWVSGSSTALVTDGPGIVLLAAVLLSCVVATWALGRSQRLQAEQIAMLAERARRAEADRQERQHAAAAAERARIARELHDVIAHSVTVMVRQAEGGRYVAATDPVAAEGALVAIADTGREALTDIRAMLGVLAEDPDRAGDGGAPLTPAPGVGDVPRLVERLETAGQPVRLRVEGEPRPLPRAADLAAYRLVQEALTNVTKHAGPQVPVEVRLRWSDTALRLEVVDQGAEVGAEPLVGGAGGGRGMVGMRERLELAGGGLSIGRAEGGGFSVAGWLPTPSSGARGGTPS